jgi:RNA polymerase sigma-70 factor (ECF subfamily)
VKQDPELEKIIDACIQNKRKAQKALYEKYCDAMFSKAYRLLNNSDDAHDVLQEAFIAVFKHIGSFRGESTIGSWIKTIVVRKALKHIRELRFFEDLNGNDIETATDFLDDLSGEYLEQLILSLPKGYRTVFLLIEVEGYNHCEVADILNISEGTSKSQLSRAKKMLRKKVELVNSI